MPDQEKQELNQKAPHEVWYNKECLAKTADHELALVAFHRAFQRLMDQMVDPIKQRHDHKKDVVVIRDLEEKAYIRFSIETGKLDEAILSEME